VSGYTEYGFEWGPMKVERTASLPEGRVVLTVRTDHRELTIYASRTGRSLRVFDGNRYELKPGKEQ
jgi:ribosomal protein S19